MYLRPAFGRVSISNIAYLLHHRKDGKYMAENPNNLQAAENAEPTAEELSEVLRVRREKFAALKEAGRNPFEQTRYDRTAYTQQIAEHFDELDEQMVSIAGRIMSKRSMLLAESRFTSNATSLARRPTTSLRNGISAISLVSRAKCSAPNTAKSPSVQLRQSCCPNPCCLCLRNSMV